MALDRQDIERRDFPIGRRGYEPEAVDAHLRRVADELDELKSVDRPSTASLASAAADQVRSIVEAAEVTATDIKGQAEDEAAGTRSRAAAEAEKTRADATDQARRHVASVQEATQMMLQRVDAMESELGALIESLRTGANRLTADLTLLTGNMGDLRGAIEASTRAVALDPNDPDALILRGQLVRTQFGLTAALPWFEGVLKRDPYNHDALIEYAATLGDAGQANAMLDATRRALAVRPGSAQAYYLQAVLAARAGRYALAQFSERGARAPARDPSRG